MGSSRVMEEPDAPGLEDGGRAKSDEDVGSDGRDTSLGMSSGEKREERRFRLCGKGRELTLVQKVQLTQGPFFPFKGYCFVSRLVDQQKTRALLNCHHPSKFYRVLASRLLIAQCGL